jgi:hypothetical protein
MKMECCKICISLPTLSSLGWGFLTMAAFFVMLNKGVQMTRKHSYVSASFSLQGTQEGDYNVLISTANHAMQWILQKNIR